MRGNYNKLARALGSHDKIVTEKRGNKAIQHTQHDRLIIIRKSACAGLCVNKEGRHRNYGIEREGNVKEIQ